MQYVCVTCAHHRQHTRTILFANEPKYGAAGELGTEAAWYGMCVVRVRAIIRTMVQQHSDNPVKNDRYDTPHAPPPSLLMWVRSINNRRGKARPNTGTSILHTTHKTTSFSVTVFSQKLSKELLESKTNDTTHNMHHRHAH